MFENVCFQQEVITLKKCCVCENPIFFCLFSLSAGTRFVLPNACSVEPPMSAERALFVRGVRCKTAICSNGYVCLSTHNTLSLQYLFICTILEKYNLSTQTGATLVKCVCEMLGQVQMKSIYLYRLIFVQFFCGACCVFKVLQNYLAISRFPLSIAFINLLLLFHSSEQRSDTKEKPEKESPSLCSCTVCC